MTVRGTGSRHVLNNLTQISNGKSITAVQCGVPAEINIQTPANGNTQMVKIHTSGCPIQFLCGLAEINIQTPANGNTQMV